MHRGEEVTVLDLGAIVACTLIWGTTWYAITHQLGAIDPFVSVTWRFALAAAVLFAFGWLSRLPMRLTAAQHVAALGVGAFTFGFQYPLVYMAEMRIASAVVAVIFAALTFCNLFVFRLAFGQRPSAGAWVAAVLGVAGVAALSWEELVRARMPQAALAGIGMAVGAVGLASIGNAFAHRGQAAGAPVIPLTAFSMAYGTILLAAAAALTGRTFAFDWRAPYLLSLLYLALFGSVVAFLLYFWLAARRGYALASYISALTPLVAMLVSTALEGKSWGVGALAGVLLLLTGQWLLLRMRRAQ